MDRSSVPPREILVVVLGFTAWAAAFVALYAINAVGCAFAWPQGVQRGVMVGLTAIACIAMVGVAIWSVRHWRRMTRASQPAPMLTAVGALGSLAALAATGFVFAPSFYASMCI